MKLQKIYDFRTMGQIFEGVPLTVWVECAKEDGSEFKGWYILSADTKYHHHNQGQYYFHQSKLASGKACQRKVSAKINKTLIDIIKCNHTYNNSQIEWFRAGSALNLIRQNEK